MFSRGAFLGTETLPTREGGASGTATTSIELSSKTVSVGSGSNRLFVLVGILDTNTSLDTYEFYLNGVLQDGTVFGSSTDVISTGAAMNMVYWKESSLPSSGSVDLTIFKDNSSGGSILKYAAFTLQNVDQTTPIGESISNKAQNQVTQYSLSTGSFTAVSGSYIVSSGGIVDLSPSAFNEPSNTANLLSDVQGSFGIRVSEDTSASSNTESYSWQTTDTSGATMDDTIVIAVEINSTGGSVSQVGTVNDVYAFLGTAKKVTPNLPNNTGDSRGILVALVYPNGGPSAPKVFLQSGSSDLISANLQKSYTQWVGTGITFGLYTITDRDGISSFWNASTNFYIDTPTNVTIGAVYFSDVNQNNFIGEYVENTATNVTETTSTTLVTSQDRSSSNIIDGGNMLIVVAAITDSVLAAPDSVPTIGSPYSTNSDFTINLTDTDAQLFLMVDDDMANGTDTDGSFDVTFNFASTPSSGVDNEIIGSFRVIGVF